MRDELTALMAAPPVKVNAAVAARAAEANDVLRAAIGEWFSFYDGYDPMFTWWMRMPYKQIDKTLLEYYALALPTYREMLFVK